MQKIHFDKEKCLSYLDAFLKKVNLLWSSVRQKTSVFIPLVISFVQKNRANLIKFAIPALILISGYAACSSSQKMITRNMQDIFLIADEIRSAYTNKPDYWGVDTKSVIQNNIVSAKYIKGEKLVLSSGTQIFVGSGEKAETVMPLTQYFDIVLPNINKAQCISYAESVLSQENLLRLFGIRIINSAGDYLFEWGGKYTLPIEKYATKDLCLDGSNTIIWSVK